MTSSLPSRRETAESFYGSLPVHWRTMRFSHATVISAGQVDPKDTAHRDKQLIAPNHVVGGTGQLLDVPTAEEQGAESGKYIVEKGDVVYSKIRPALRKVVVAPFDGLCSADMYAIKPSEGVDSRFLFWLILSEGFSKAVVLESMRVAMPKVNRDTLGATPVIIPPLPIQRAIADFLEKKTAAIDALIAKKERLIELLEEKRQALITQAVTKGLDPNVPMKDSGIEWLGEIPAHWEVRRNRALLQEVNQRSETGDETLLTVSHLRGVSRREDNPQVSMTLAETTVGYKRCQLGDLAVNTMWAWMGAVGTCSEAGIVSPSYNVYRFRKPAEVDHRYYDLLYRTPQHVEEIVRFSKGVWTSRLRLYRQEFLGFMHSPVPPADEQRAIVEHVRSINERDAQHTDKTTRSLQLLREYRQALITEAVTGKLDVLRSTEDRRKGSP